MRTLIISIMGIAGVGFILIALFNVGSAKTVGRFLVGGTGAGLVLGVAAYYFWGPWALFLTFIALMTGGLMVQQIVDPRI